MRIGLSGGIGCGKSTALEIFSACGFPTFSADVCSRELLSDGDAVRFVMENFGSECVDTSGVRRDALARVVFSDDVARKRLEDFLHPRIEVSWRKFCDEAETTGKIPVVEIPLLFEKSYEAEFDLTVCVACSRETQLARLAGRGVREDDAKSRIAAQLPLEDKVSRADILLSNDGSFEFLERQIKIFSRSLPQQK